MSEQTPDKLSEAFLQEIIAGCEGVTPGPYHVYLHQEGIAEPKRTAFIEDVHRRLIATLFQGSPSSRYADNADHFARLDPATVSAMATLALEALRMRDELAEAQGVTSHDALERSLADAFRRGWQWNESNRGEAEYLNKAANDYADFALKGPTP